MYFLRRFLLPEVEKEAVIRILLLKNAKLWLKMVTKKLHFLGKTWTHIFGMEVVLKKDFDKASEMQKATAVNFAQLLEMVAKAVPAMRIRFSHV